MPRPEEILARLRDALVFSDPQWDVSVGTPEYKILEAVSMEVANYTNDSTLLATNFDIDTKAGQDLDNFVRLFGFERLQAKRATGTVTFSRGTLADQDYVINFGTQVYTPSTATSPAVYFQTTVTAVLPQTQTQIEVPVEAVVGGSAGNVAAGKITNINATINGVTAVLNENGFTGGRDQESDADLRSRWRRTVLRNISGTEDQFLGLAYNEEAVSRAIVIGAVENHREQLTVAAGAVTSTVPDSKYTYAAGGEFLGKNLGASTEELATRTVDYTFVQPGVAPFQPTANLTAAGLLKFPNGSVVEFEHEYTPASSRNDPATGVVDKVDIFVAGDTAQDVSEETVQGSELFAASGALLNTNWIREDGATAPTVGNRLLRLAKVPVISLPATITVGGTTYTKNTHYWLVRDNRLGFRYSTRAQDGIEWLAAGTPAAGTAMTVEYFFNSLIERINEQVNLVRLIGMDTLAHRANYLRMRFNLVIMLRQGATADQAKIAIEDALTLWLESKSFKDSLQVADLYDVVSSVPFVDNVRLVTSGETLDEVQTLTIGATAGQYRLTFDGLTTADIAFNAAAGTIQTALNNAGLTYITAAGTGSTRTFTFGAAWADRNAPLIAVSNGTTPFTGGTMVMTETTAGIGHGMQVIAENGFNILATYTADRLLDSDTIPIFNDVEILVRGVNTF